MKSLVLNNEDSIYDLWLSRINGVGSITFQNLTKQFGNSREVFFADKEKFSNLTNQLRTDILNSRSERVLVSLESELKKLDISYLSFVDDLYPRSLLQIPDFPPVIYLKGRIDLLSEMYSRKWISIVGTRKSDAYGKSVCEKIAKGLVDYGFVVVSGMAFGIDKLAHLATIDNNGFTVAVLGAGVDIISPESNRRVYNQILQKGVVLSELPPGTKPANFTFPQRNRIISGLSSGVIVIQAGEKSGSLITARLALEQNREVFAVPDNIYKQTGKGTNNLIKCSGAKLVQSVEDILEELNPDYLKEEKIEKSKKNIKDPEALSIYQILVANDGLYFDEIATKSGDLDESGITKVLSDLELNCLINRAEDGRYYPSL